MDAHEWLREYVQVYKLISDEGELEFNMYDIEKWLNDFADFKVKEFAEKDKRQDENTKVNE